jgi:hypothetical protein
MFLFDQELWNFGPAGASLTNLRKSCERFAHRVIVKLCSDEKGWFGLRSCQWGFSKRLEAISMFDMISLPLCDRVLLFLLPLILLGFEHLMEVAVG